MLPAEDLVAFVVSAVFVAGAAGATPAAAQRSQPAPRPTRAEGRVVRVGGRESVPVPGARVVLHRIARLQQGPIDSTLADRAGRFRLRFTADTASLYLVSSRYDGIEYFSPPLHTNPDQPDTAVVLTVADTSSTAPVSLAARHLVVSRPAEDGTRSGLELLVLSNEGTRTRVSPDTVRGSFAMPLPPGAFGFGVGEGDLAGDAVVARNDSLIVFAPLSPGQKQTVVSYSIPADAEEWRVPIEPAPGQLSIMVEEPNARVSGGTLAFADSQSIRGHVYRRFTGRVPAGGTITVHLPSARRAGRWWLAGLVSAAGALLALGTWLAVRRRRPAPAPAGSSPSPLDAIAALDARYAGREGDVTAAEWADYQATRARLKRELEAALAHGGLARRSGVT